MSDWHFCHVRFPRWSKLCLLLLSITNDRIITIICKYFKFQAPEFMQMTRYICMLNGSLFICVHNYIEMFFLCSFSLKF